MSEHDVVILGVFVADTAYRASRQPKMGETILGSGFALGPGGKGSNQAVACARAGARTAMLTKLGSDTFGDMAMETWKDAGVVPLVERGETPTGAAFIFVDDATGNNAIIIYPGAAGEIDAAFIEARADTIRAARVFVTQLEQPIDAALAALRIAREAGVETILNPAPAASLPEGTLQLCDYVTPNETEAETLTGLPVETVEEARAAAARLLEMGVAKAAILTLGERGALYHDGETSELVPPFDAGPVVETTGAGDAFNGGFAAALAEGRDALEAVRFGCATASISVTRPGTAPSMPARAEIDALLAG
ncbi:ribokinase [Jannaschia aquimarina]|uniref:Ribokinase n=1 Tax=Jannaschia aquimarina TaxID=935700 RepID=A0A0D1EB14_9RHOB|nr:ribokinase [Jannaschia aquimarina]KIT14939.1 Ribokinase [Jannaschia aquimarina]SNS59905.1 6-phosphofructokinase [Jannaschia aquimarina]